MSNFISPAVQAMNIIRYIGDEVSRTNTPIGQLSNVPDTVFFSELLEELENRGLVKMTGKPVRSFQGTTFLDVNLTLDGWEKYEAEKRGEFRGNYGFIAMQFGDSELDPFVKNVVKPAVKEGIGYDLVDMRDVAQAGVIDNILRTQIRDAAFLLVDLTHDNPGAYWEAGYAEGLGKPVIYICEKKKFDGKKTHFDTNHCTTVIWSKDDTEGFKQALTATLRRSLD